MREFAFAGALAAGLAACSSTPGQLPISFTEKAPSYTAPASPPAGALVVLSYPAEIDPSLLPLVESRYQAQPLGGDSNHDWDEALSEALAHSAFYVADLYRELAARLPEGQVVLQPASLVRGAGGQPTYRIPAPELPAVLRVDFMAYCKPSKNIIGKYTGPQSFGQDVSPIILVSAEREASPATGGAVVGPAGLAPPPAAELGQPSLLLQLLADTRVPPSMPIDRERPARPNLFLQMPVVEYAIPDEEWGSYVASPPLTPSPVRSRLAGHVNVIVDLLSELDPHQATAAQRSAYYRMFDPAVGEGAEDADRRELLDRFARAEGEFLHKQNMAVLEAMLGGEWGSSMRSRITAEREAQAAAETADQIAALGVLTGGIASFALGGAIITPAASMAALNQTSSAVNGIMDGQRMALADVSRQQIYIATSIQSEQRIVQVETLAELRQNLLKIYHEVYPNL